MLPALNNIGIEQATPTQNTEEKYERLLDYAVIYPNAFIIYHASQIVLHVDSDAAYLVMPQV